MKNYRLFLIVALLGTVLASCQKEKEIATPGDEPVVEKAWTLVIQATKDVDTKALNLDTSGAKHVLNSEWAEGETVNVFFGAEPIGSLSVTAVDAGGKATLSGKIIGEGLKATDVLTLLAPGRSDNGWTYLGQDGTTPTPDGTLSKGYDYATASLTVSELDDVNKVITTTGDVSFTNEQSIYRFGFSSGGNLIKVKSFTISSNQGKIVSSRTHNGTAWVSNYDPITVTINSSFNPSDNLYFMALRNEATADDTYSFSVVGSSDNKLYEGTKTIAAASIVNGKFLNAKSITVTAKALTPNSSIKIKKEVDVL